MTYGVFFELNKLPVTPPDEEVWVTEVVGTALSGHERRSPYRMLTWTKRTVDCSRIDWFDYDGVTLESITTRGYDQLVEHETYTSALCLGVAFRQREGVGMDIVARFLVNINSAI